MLSIHNIKANDIIIVKVKKCFGSLCDKEWEKTVVAVDCCWIFCSDNSMFDIVSGICKFPSNSFIDWNETKHKNK